MTTFTYLRPLPAIGVGVLVAAITFLYYAKAHQDGQPGGYLPLTSGSFIIGVLAFSIIRRAQQAEKRSILAPLIGGVITAGLFAGFLTAVLIWALGS